MALMVYRILLTGRQVGSSCPLAMVENHTHTTAFGVLVRYRQSCLIDAYCLDELSWPFLRAFVSGLSFSITSCCPFLDFLWLFLGAHIHGGLLSIMYYLPISRAHFSLPISCCPFLGAHFSLLNAHFLLPIYRYPFLWPISRAHFSLPTSWCSCPFLDARFSLPIPHCPFLATQFSLPSSHAHFLCPFLVPISRSQFLCLFLDAQISMPTFRCLILMPSSHYA
jgi:hypothetical protein